MNKPDTWKEEIQNAMSFGRAWEGRIENPAGGYFKVRVCWMPPHAIATGELFDASGWSIRSLNYGDEVLRTANAAGESGINTYRESGRMQSDEATAKELHESTIKRIRSKGRRGYVRFGKPPISGFSRNHRDGYSEPGVSVYRSVLTPGGQKAIVEISGCDQASAMFIVSRDCYEVTGEETGVGSDGEPCLRNLSVVGRIREWVVN